MDDPLVSIFIPVYNRENYLSECVESAASQTYKNIEIIIYDNCSTDNTWQVCNELAAKDSRIRVFRNEKNVGPVRNWLCCLEKARGFLGKFLFSDDLMFSQYLELSVPFFENNEVGFVYSAAVVGPDKNCNNIKYGGTKPVEYVSSDDYLFGSLFLSNFPLSPGCAIFRSNDLRENLLTEIPSPRISNFSDHGAGIDQLIFLRIAKKYNSIVHLSLPLVFFRQHDDSITMAKCRDNSDIFFKYYHQASLWFAKENLPKPLFIQYCVFLWRREQKKSKQKYSISGFMAEYFFEHIKIEYWIRVYCVLIIKIRNLKNKVLKIFSK